MTGLPYSVGEHPRSTPDESYPCAACQAEHAAQMLRDAVTDALRDDANGMRAMAEAEFMGEFGEQVERMARWCHDTAYEDARRQDHQDCEMHRQTREDEE